MDYQEEQRQEVASLKSIFPGEFAELNTFPPTFMIRIDDVDISTFVKSLQLKVSFPSNYPDEIPSIEIPNRRNALPIEVLEELVNFLKNSSKEYIGMPMIFALVDLAKEWINENNEKFRGFDKGEADSHEESNMQELSAPQSLKDRSEVIKVKGGKWNFVIGLIGKPSAGKSTFFNAATHQNTAKIGAHPFTTIEPNIGQALYAIPCPCFHWNQRCDAEYGHSALGERLVPVLLKDVAGLVPGACEGRGRGNKFLNDLLEADVLIHVVDLSGHSDQDGKPTTEYDPTKDVAWIEEELHRWIYDNIMSKWISIRKKPTKLYDMFSGYHASQALIQLVFESAEISDAKLLYIPKMENLEAEQMVHKLVDKFLQLRFPILLALNKIDLADAVDNLETFKDQFKDKAMMPVSAAIECALQQKCKEGFISYQSGASQFCIVKEARDFAQEITAVEENVLKSFESTGVLRALSQAVNLRSPTYAFPVQCLDTYHSIGAKPNGEPQIMRDCIVLKPGTTVGKLFDIICYLPVPLLAGEYVRAEGIDSNKVKKVLHKNDLISKSNQIVKIMTTKKAPANAKTRH